MIGGLDGAHDSGESAAYTEQASQALFATLDPRVTNYIRQQALSFLEQIKTDHNAPQYGFTLADDYMAVGEPILPRRIPLPATIAGLSMIIKPVLLSSTHVLQNVARLGDIYQ
jgi:hypothetical protein